jgi:hypothetical protein
LRIAVAVIAGLGIAIKPYFVLPWLLVEFHLLVKRGLETTLRDCVPWIVAAMLAAHLLLAVLFTPDYFSMMRAFGAAIYINPAEMIGHAAHVLAGPYLLPVLLALLFLLPMAFMCGKALPKALAIFALGCVAEAAVQGKGWDYHALPAIAATLLLGVIVVCDWMEGRDNTSVIAAALLIPLLFLEALKLRPFIDQLEFGESEIHAWVRVMERAPNANRKALVLSSGVFPQFPAITYADVQLPTPFLNAWPLHGLYGDYCKPDEADASGYRPLDRQPSGEAVFFRKTVEGLVTARPALLVIDLRDGIGDCMGKAFDYLAYFGRDPAFAKALTHYRPTVTLGQYAFYERKD